MSKKYVYQFSEGNASMRNLLGGKGANLAEMTKIGLPVPQGFTISTEACTQYYEDGRRINDEIQKELSALLRTVKDPRVTDRMLTITHVDTTSDLRYARIYVSALNCPDEKGLLKGLKSAAGYLRHELGSRIDLRYTPELQFFVDDSIAYGAHILDMLNHVKPADPRNADIVLPEDRED